MKLLFDIKRIAAFVLAVGFVLSQNVYAANVGDRDLAADEMLLVGTQAGKAGILPATGSPQAALAAILPQLGQLNRGAEKETVNLQGVSGSGFKDNKANVYSLEGEVKIRSKGQTEWSAAEKGMLVLEGSEILTGQDGQVSITYDTGFINVSHIPGNTKAEFRSIEPTDIYLSDGRIYNVFDGLPKNSNWTVSTPVAVSAVRGTWFVVSFAMADGTFVTATFDVPDDGHASEVEVIEVVEGKTGEKSATVPEGNQIELKEGEQPDPSLVGAIDAKWMAQILDFLEKLGNYRALNDGALPPTGSDFFSGGAGGGEGGNELDPQLDTGGTQGELEDSPPTGPFFEDEDPGGPGDCEDFENCGGGGPNT